MFAMAGDFPHLKASKIVVGHTHPTLQWLWGSLPQEYRSNDVKVPTPFYLVLKLRKHGAILPLAHTFSWCGMQVKFHYTVSHVKWWAAVNSTTYNMYRTIILFEKPQDSSFRLFCKTTDSSVITGIPICLEMGSISAQSTCVLGSFSPYLKKFYKWFPSAWRHMSQLKYTVFSAHKYSAINSQNTTIRSTENTTGMNCLKKTPWMLFTSPWIQKLLLHSKLPVCKQLHITWVWICWMRMLWSPVYYLSPKILSKQCRVPHN